MTDRTARAANQRSRLDAGLVQPSSGQRAREEERIQRSLADVAKPDSRYQLNLDFFIPDFDGSADAAALLADTAEYRRASRIFVTPDNALIEIRKRCLADGKTMVLPSYGLTRGFLELDPGRIEPAAIPFAAWLDGIQHFSRPMPLADLRNCEPFGLVIAGAAAVTGAGLRFGMGHRYLDIEWGLFAGVGLLAAATPVATMVHPCQLSQLDLEIEAADVTADIIAMPDRIMRASQGLRLSELDETLLSEELAATEVVTEYRALTR